MTGQMRSLTSYDVTTKTMATFCRASSGLFNQCKFISVCLNRMKIHGGRSIHPPSHLYHDEGMKSRVLTKTILLALIFKFKATLSFLKA